MRAHCRFIAMPTRHLPDLMRELAEAMGDKRPSDEELLRLAKQLNNIPHWFEADYDERPSPRPGAVECFLVPGTLRDLGPVTLDEMKAYLAKQFEAALAAEHRRRISLL